MKYKQDARFYFANLGVDVARCVSAVNSGNMKRFSDSLKCAHKTLSFLRDSNRPEAYEEGLLLLRALQYARTNGKLREFNEELNKLISQYAPTFKT